MIEAARRDVPRHRVRRRRPPRLGAGRAGRRPGLQRDPAVGARPPRAASSTRRRRRAGRLVRVPGARQLRRAEPHDPPRPGRAARRTPSTPPVPTIPPRTTRPTTTTCWLTPAAPSTSGRRRTCTSSAAPTRCSPGSPGPAPGRLSRRCPTTCAPPSRRSSRPGSPRPTRPVPTAPCCCRSAGSSWWPRVGRAVRLHHVQVACPPGGEDEARRFYGAGLGLTEVDEAGRAGGPRRRLVPRRRLRAARRCRGPVRAGPEGAPGVRRRFGRRARRCGATGSRRPVSRSTSGSVIRSPALRGCTRMTLTPTVWSSWRGRSTAQ